MNRLLAHPLMFFLDEIDPGRGGYLERLRPTAGSFAKHSHGRKNGSCERVFGWGMPALQHGLHITEDEASSVVAGCLMGLVSGVTTSATRVMIAHPIM